MILPKYNVIYYKEILDSCFKRFFDEYNDQFSKIDNEYVLSKTFSKTKIKQIFTEYIFIEFSKFVKPFDLVSQPNFYIIINGCKPQENIMLKYKDSNYFPKKLQQLIQTDFQPKYILAEKDIRIDLVKFNECFIEIFNRMFRSVLELSQKFLGYTGNNIILVQHKYLDCWMIYKIIKHIYGNRNIVNLAEQYTDKKILVGINDLICKYIQNKKEISKSKEFKLAYTEIKQYLEGKTTSING